MTFHYPYLTPNSASRPGFVFSLVGMSKTPPPFPAAAVGTDQKKLRFVHCLWRAYLSPAIQVINQIRGIQGIVILHRHEREARFHLPREKRKKKTQQKTRGSYTGMSVRRRMRAGYHRGGDHLVSLEKNCPLMKEAYIAKLEEAYIANLLSIGNFEYFTEEEYIFFRSSYKRELTIYKLPNKSVF